MSKNRINFATAAQAAMFKHEFLGQFSDGAWENSPGAKWRDWCPVEVKVDDQNVGRNFHVGYDRYNLARKDLLEVVEQRLLGIARVATRWGTKAAGMLEGFVFDCCGWTGLPKHKGEYWDKKRSEIALWLESAGTTLDEVKAVVTDETYDAKALRRDLKEMKLMMRMRCRDEATPAPKPVAPINPAERYAKSHGTNENEQRKLQAAYEAGQRRDQ